MSEPSLASSWPMQLGPTLETERLILRPPVQADIEGWAAFCADPVVMKHLGGPLPRPLAWRNMASLAGYWALQGFGMFSVIEKATGRWIGRLGPIHPDSWPGDEVGWGLAREAWGKGYAYEGAAACMDYAAEVLGWEDIIHTIATENHASQAVARRLGSRLRGPCKLPPPFENDEVEVWGQTREEWRARRRA